MDKINCAIGLLRKAGFRNLLFVTGGATLFALEASQAKIVANPSFFYPRRQSHNLYDRI
jgi:hypothetical protein